MTDISQTRGMLSKVVKAVRSLQDKTSPRALAEPARRQASTAVSYVNSFRRRSARRTSAARRFMDRDFLPIVPPSPTTTTTNRSHRSRCPKIEHTVGESMTQYSNMRLESPTIPAQCMVFRPSSTSSTSVSSTETLALSSPSMSAEGLARTMSATRQLGTVVAAQDDANRDEVNEVDEIAEVAEIMRQRAELDNRLLAIQSRRNAGNAKHVASPEQTDGRGTSAGLTSMNSDPTSTYATTHGKWSSDISFLESDSNDEAVPADAIINDDNKTLNSVAPLRCITENNASATRPIYAGQEDISSPIVPLRRVEEGRNTNLPHAAPLRHVEEAINTYPLRIAAPRRPEERNVSASFPLHSSYNNDIFLSDSTPTAQIIEDAINEAYPGTNLNNNNSLLAREAVRTIAREEDPDRQRQYDEALKLLTQPDPNSPQETSSQSPLPTVMGQNAFDNGPSLPAFSWALPSTPTDDIDDVVSYWMQTIPSSPNMAQVERRASQSSFADIRPFVESELRNPATSPTQLQAVSPLPSALRTPQHQIFPAAHVNDSPSKSPKVRFFDEDAQLQLQKAREAIEGHGENRAVSDTRSTSEACLSGQSGKPGKESRLKTKFSSLNFRNFSSPFRSSVRDDGSKKSATKGRQRAVSPPPLLPSNTMLSQMPPSAMPSTRMLANAPSFNLSPSKNLTSSGRVMSSNNLTSPNSLISSDGLVSPGSLASPCSLTFPNNLTSPSKLMPSSGLVSPSNLMSSSDLRPSDTAMPSSSNSKAVESPNSPHSLYDFAAFGVKPPPMVSHPCPSTPYNHLADPPYSSTRPQMHTAKSMDYQKSDAAPQTSPATTPSTSSSTKPPS